ncbi:hypothetical protein CHS0354_000104 [Potamilus streckersoni]|uniref:Uncharacterized protein n=1 Tax=Potamilus streckersoni TaxID=2493646 RepID=A0AAE0TIR9_9BIVA|nr:hypothetical protein CHS0354_000104 [Potamilus streckersoni]
MPPVVASYDIEGQVRLLPLGIHRISGVKSSALIAQCISATYAMASKKDASVCGVKRKHHNECSWSFIENN